MLTPSQAMKMRLQYFFDRPSYTVAPGGTVEVIVSIQETFNPRTDYSRLVPGTDGLIRGGVFVEASSPTRGRPARVRDIADIIGNAGFDLAILPQLAGTVPGGSTGLVELSANPVFGTLVSRSANCATVLLPLGTFKFTASNTPGEETLLTAVAGETCWRAPADNNVTNSGLVLDRLLEPGTATITVIKPSREHNGHGLTAGLADVLNELRNDTDRRRR